MFHHFDSVPMKIWSWGYLSQMALIPIKAFMGINMSKLRKPAQGGRGVLKVNTLTLKKVDSRYALISK